MHVDLHCRECGRWFSPSTDSANADILEQIRDEGPWAALGDGETVEDRISVALESHGEMHCPGCGAPVSLCEEDLGRMSLQLLEQW